MRQNWANGRREIAGFVGPYFGLQTSDRNVRSFTRSHASPFRGGRHKSFQLFTTRVDTDFQKIVPNIDTEEEEEEIEFAGKDELIDPVELSNDEESSSLAGLSPGSNDGFFVTGLFKTTEGEFDFEQVQSLVDYADIQRLGLTPYNISAPVALLMLNPSEFPTLTRARKACRKANVMIHRGPLAADEKTGEDAFDLSKCFRARVGDRVFPGGRFLVLEAF